MPIRLSALNLQPGLTQLQLRRTGLDRKLLEACRDGRQ
jgi:hypothetical protein